MNKNVVIGLFGAMIAVSVAAFGYTGTKSYDDQSSPLPFSGSSSTLYTDTPNSVPTTVYATTTVPFRAPVFANSDNNSNTAFNTMMSDSNGLRYVWRGVKVTVNGVGLNGGRNLEILKEAIESINALKYPNVPYLEVTDGPSDVILHSLEQTEWSSILGSFAGKSGIDGLTRTLWEDDGSLVKATIVVDSSSSQWQRNRTIVHELLHSLGLGHHRCPSGILEESATYSPYLEVKQL